MEKIRVENFEDIHTHTHTCYLKKKGKNEKAITLIALVIAIAILIILAGVVIVALGGENGLLTQEKQEKQAATSNEMERALKSAIEDLKTEKSGDATLDDVTQEWIDEQIKDYECTIKYDASIKGRKVLMRDTSYDSLGNVYQFIIDENLDITQIQVIGNEKLLRYEAISKSGDDVTVSITIKGRVYRDYRDCYLKKVQCPNGDEHLVYANQIGEDMTFNYTVPIGEEQIFKIELTGIPEIEETVLINDYYYKITKDIDEGISIDNKAVMVKEHSGYEATITVEDGYIIDEFEVKMGGIRISPYHFYKEDSDKKGIIEIPSYNGGVTGDIEITAKRKKLEIQVTKQEIVRPSTIPEDVKLELGEEAYIYIEAELEGNKCKIVLKDNPEKEIYGLPVIQNGKYKFKAIGKYGSQEITKEIEVLVDIYESLTGLVQYDAGSWTEEEINSLKNNKLYDLNTSQNIGDGSFKLQNDGGLNFTFGGFTYRGDTQNSGVIRSRNKSIKPLPNNNGMSKYYGWEILSTEIKTDSSGNTIKNADGTDRIYVRKIMHCGIPECFVYYYTEGNDAYRAEYLLSGGTRRTTYNKLSDGKTTINPRSWDMYRDQELDTKGYIEEVHVMTYDEGTSIDLSVEAINDQERNLNYLLATAHHNGAMWGKDSGNNNYFGVSNRCWGIRPVITMADGVYISSGTGLDYDPYVLAKE